MLCWIARTRYVVASTTCNLQGSGAVLLLLPYSSIWNDSEQATCELPLLSLFVRGHVISNVLESFADWTMFHAAERRQCELPLLSVATHMHYFTPRELVNPLCRPPCCTMHQPKENHTAGTNRGRALPFISNTFLHCIQLKMD